MTGSRTPVRPTVDPDIPQVVGKTGAEAQALTAIKQILDVGLTKNGASPYDGFVRVRDLVALNLAQVDLSGGRGRVTGGGSIPGGTGGGPNPFLQPPNPGGNPRPTTFTGLRTVGLWNGIRIFWNYPSVTSTGAALEYAGVEVYGAQEIDGQIPSFAQAVSVGTVSGATNFFTHDLGPAGFGQTWWYWLRWLYITNSQFPIPYSQFTPGEDSQGVRGKSDPQPSELVDALVGQVTDDLLELGLGDRIARGEFTTAGVQTSLNARLLVADATGRAAIAQVAAVRGSLQTVLTGTYSVRTDLNGYVTGFGFTASVGTDDLNPFLPGDQLFDSAFIIRANRFAIQVPNEPGAPPELAGGRIPFVIGQIVNPDWTPPPDDPSAEPTVANGGIIDAVGIDGRLAVKGTIHADALKAGTIGARHIDAFSIATEVLSAESIITGSLATGGDANWRVVIGNADSLFPLWYGLGQVGDQSIYDANGAAISGTVFSMDRLGNTKLAGSLTVTGGGRFSTDGGATGFRFEIGGTDGLIAWAGSGHRSLESGKFVIDADGNIFIRGMPLTVPYAAGGESVSFTVVPQPGQPTAACLIIGNTVVLESPAGQSSDGDDKHFALEILVNGAVVQTVEIDDFHLEMGPVSIHHVGSYAGNISVQLRVRHISGNTVALSQSTLVLLQVQGST